mgnify:CR=1 FL=1|tara:strand:+ start:100 stop:1728 length:1629 start_codon:yes stop_codon:yes gene_type:complete
MEYNESNLIDKGPCDDCGSSDACCIYDDGHTHCFSCGTHKGNQVLTEKINSNMSKPKSKMIHGEAMFLKARGLTEESCRKWRYTVGSHHGKPVQIANYCNENGTAVSQKIRTKDKDFTILGETKLGLYGQQLWKGASRKSLVITEGEIDAISVSQIQDHKWPVVSLPTGAGGAKKTITSNLEWIEEFDSVILMFDNDEVGKKAAVECAGILGNKAKIAELPMKDPNAMLLAGKGAEVVYAKFNAKGYTPVGIVLIDDIIEEAQKPIEVGHPWPWDTLTDLTYGRRHGEVSVWGGGVGCGKTDIFTQIMASDIERGDLVAPIYLESSLSQVAIRLAGKLAKVPFHVPDEDRDPKLLEEALELTKSKVWMVDNKGGRDWDTIKNKIRWLALDKGVRSFYLDNLTVLSAQASDERRFLDFLMDDMHSLVENLDISINVISHLSTPEGKSHEEGGRVMAKHMTGSRAIMRYADWIFGLERNTQAEGDECTDTTLRILKDRDTGRSLGKTIKLKYNPDTGILNESYKHDDFTAIDEDKGDTSVNPEF